MSRSLPPEPARVLLVHNRYQQPGGEDTVFEAEHRLLERHGHAVQRLTFDNDDIPQQGSPLGAVRLAAATVWSRGGAARVGAAARAFRADVVHFHNTFPLVSPAAYAASRREGAAVVQTLHNYRLLCPGATFYRDGRPCEDCLGRPVPWPGVAHACYRGSRAATATTAAMLTVHRALGTWERSVDAYIALTDFARDKFVAGGLPANKVVVKPNFVDVEFGPGAGTGGYALFVGRLTPEKGIATLLAAWEQLGGRIPLRVVGDGPLGGEVAAATRRLSGVEWLGRRPHAEIFPLMADAACLIFPSEWYEGFGLTIVEALAVGTPCIAADIGAMRSLIEPGRTGSLFAAGDPADLAATVERAWDTPGLLAGMRPAARAEYEAKYTAAQNGRLLRAIYEQALRVRRGEPAS